MSRFPNRARAVVVTIALALALLAPVAAPVAAQANATATLNITFLGCPPGGDWTGPPQGCAEVVPAPASAVVTAGTDQVQRLRDVAQNPDGTYTLQVEVPAQEGVRDVGLVNFFPENYNAFTFTGVDTLTRWYGGVNLAAGETRDVTVFFWNGPVDLIMPAENTLVVNVWTCDEGIDPNVDASGCVPAEAEAPGLEIGTSPLRDFTLDQFLTREGGTLTYAGLPPYTQAQVVVQEPMPGYAEALVTGQAEVIEDDAATAFLLRAEYREINVYFYAPDGSDKVTPAPTPAPEAGTGTLRLMLLACPAGVVPHDDPGRCTEALAAPADAMVEFPESGERMALARFQRDEAGAYLITGVRGEVIVEGVVSSDYDRLASDADTITGEQVTYAVEEGQTREGRLYYFDAP